MTCKEDMLEVVKSVLEHYMTSDIEEVALTSRIDEDLGVADFEMIDVTFDLEDELGIDIDDNVMDGWRTVSDIVNTVSSLVRD